MCPLSAAAVQAEAEAAGVQAKAAALANAAAAGPGPAASPIGCSEGAPAAAPAATTGSHIPEPHTETSRGNGAAAAVTALQALLESAANALSAQKQAERAAAEAGSRDEQMVTDRERKSAEGNATAALEALRAILDAATEEPGAEGQAANRASAAAGAQGEGRQQGSQGPVHEQACMGMRGAPAAAAVPAAAGPPATIPSLLLQGFGNAGSSAEPAVHTPLSVYVYEEILVLLKQLDSLHCKLMWLDVCAGFFVAGCLTWEQHARYILGSWPHAGSLLPFARRLAGLKAAKKILQAALRPAGASA